MIMVQVYYKKDDKKYNFGIKSKRAEAEKLFTKIKKKEEPYFTKNTVQSEPHLREVPKQEKDIVPENPIFENKQSKIELLRDFPEKEILNDRVKAVAQVAQPNVITKYMIWVDSVNLLKEYIKITPSHLVESSISDIAESMKKIINGLNQAKEVLENEKVSEQKPVIKFDENSEPAVPVNESVHNDYLICLEDGAHVKMLTRYIQRFGHTQLTYIKKFNLPEDYPFYPPNASQKRREVAIKNEMWKKSNTGKLSRKK